MNLYPLWKITCEQTIDRRKSSKYDVYEIKCKTEHSDWMTLYVTCSRINALTAYNKLKDIFDIYIKYFINEEKEYTMFEYANQIYKTTYIFPDQSCICGENIPGNNRYGEFDVGSVKFDYVLSTIFFYEQGDCLLKCNQLFLDGVLLLNSHELSEVCKEIGQDMLYLDSSPDKLINYIKNNYKSAKRYLCEGYSQILDVKE